jgi:Vitamin K-dependent gamma-carboxylase
MNESSVMLPIATQLREALGHKITALLERISGHKYALYGLSVVRIGYGLVLIGILLINYHERRLLWGPESPWTYEIFRGIQQDRGGLSLFQISSSGAWFELVYHLTIVLCVLFVLGWRTRWITPALLVAVWSWQERTPIVTDGGDNLLRLTLIYLCFAQLSAHWSLDAHRAARQQTAGHEVANRERLGWRVATVVHNSAVLAALFQVCLLYMASGLYKVQGQSWQDGTSLYYMLQIETLQSWPDLSRLIYTNSTVLVISAYLAVFIQVAFPFLMLNSATRRLELIAIIGMHIGIGVLLALPFFSLIMIVTDMLFIRDATYRRATLAVMALWERWRNRTSWSRSRASPGTESLTSAFASFRRQANRHRRTASELVRFPSYRGDIAF